LEQKLHVDCVKPNICNILSCFIGFNDSVVGVCRIVFVVVDDVIVLPVCICFFIVSLYEGSESTDYPNYGMISLNEGNISDMEGNQQDQWNA
jgi:hypothetical protein